MRKESVSWVEIDPLVDHLVEQFSTEFERLCMINPGGIVPCGILAEQLGIKDVSLISVSVQDEFQMDQQRNDPKLIAWPKICQFPPKEFFQDRRILIIGSAWGTGRTMTSVKNRISGSGGIPYTAVLHFNPMRNLFPEEKPDFFSAVTDAWIIYPWETTKGKDLILS